MNKSNLKSKCKKIKLLISDVDGVLTDGGMFYSSRGEQLKRFHTRDGMGIELLLQKKIPTVLITKEKSKIAEKRAKKIRAASIYIGILEKEKKLPEIRKKFNVMNNQIAYIGDDVNDLSLLSQVGFSASPYDATDSVKKQVDYVCKSRGGEGVLREIADLIIQYNNS